MARRHLGMSPAEWDGISWHERRMYLEGFEDEGLLSYGAPGPSSRPIPGNNPPIPDKHESGGFARTAERHHNEGRNTVVERDYHKNLSGVPGEFAALGFREVTLP